MKDWKGILTTKETKEKDCQKEKNQKIDFNDIFNYENVYDMKKLKEEVGIPLYPAPAPKTDSSDNENNTQNSTEMEKLQNQNENKTNNA